MKKQIGQTKAVGFQFGLRKTFPISVEDAWDFCFSESGLKIWLGELETDFELKKEFQTKNGISGLVRIFKPDSHIRINWKKEDWENKSTVQIRIFGNQEKATISFHQEKLMDGEQRTEMKIYWNEVMEGLSEAIKARF